MTEIEGEMPWSPGILTLRACLGHRYYAEQNTSAPNRAHIQLLIFTE
jgi:hypothetical protein